MFPCLLISEDRKLEVVIKGMAVDFCFQFLKVIDFKRYLRDKEFSSKQLKTVPVLKTTNNLYFSNKNECIFIKLF